MNQSNAEENVPALGDHLTNPDFWDAAYKNRQLLPFDDVDWRNYVAIQVVNKIKSLRLDKKNVCEAGGGDAALACYFAKKYTDSSFSIVDYSPLGCAMARERADKEKVAIEIIQADLFAPSLLLRGRFDIVYSLGLVEHFLDLSSVLSAKATLLKNDGLMFSLIPNFGSPIYTALCKRWSISVYEDHVPHTIDSFVSGHESAGLEVIEEGYLGSVEFGILSLAMEGPEKKSRWDPSFYLWLTRLSKLIHLFEDRTLSFPTSRWLSPFLYVISKKTA